MKKVFVFILLVITICAGYGVYMYMKPVANVTNVGPDFRIKSTALFNEFENDEEAASVKYIGKIIEVTGVVNDKLADKTGLTIILDAGNEIFGINCGLNDDQTEKFDSIESGQSITLRGSCSGYAMDVVLIRSVIIN